MIIHVLPGDAQVEDFTKIGLEGDVVVCREALVQGEVRAESLDEFWDVRERFHVQNHPDARYRETVVSEFEKLLHLPEGTEVDLWFEYELFCQVNLWFCVWLLRDSNTEIYRIAPITQRKDNVWSGFGGLSSDQLKECYDERLKFTDSDIDLGVELWEAFRDGDHTRLKELSKTESACFPYLKEVCEAEIEKDTRPKKVLSELRQEGIGDFGEVFAAFRERAGVYGFGDEQVKRILTEI